MAMEVRCGQCSGRLLVESPGVIVACPHCGVHLSIPLPETEKPIPPAINLEKVPAPQPPKPEPSKPQPEIAQDQVGALPPTKHSAETIIHHYQTPAVQHAGHDSGFEIQTFPDNPHHPEEAHAESVECNPSPSPGWQLPQSPVEIQKPVEPAIAPSVEEESQPQPFNFGGFAAPEISATNEVPAFAFNFGAPQPESKSQSTSPVVSGPIELPEVAAEPQKVVQPKVDEETVIEEKHAQPFSFGNSGSSDVQTTQETSPFAFGFGAPQPETISPVVSPSIEPSEIVAEPQKVAEPAVVPSIIEKKQPQPFDFGNFASSEIPETSEVSPFAAGFGISPTQAITEVPSPSMELPEVPAEIQKPVEPAAVPPALEEKGTQPFPFGSFSSFETAPAQEASPFAFNFGAAQLEPKFDSTSSAVSPPINSPEVVAQPQKAVEPAAQPAVVEEKQPQPFAFGTFASPETPSTNEESPFSLNFGALPRDAKSEPAMPLVPSPVELPAVSTAPPQTLVPAKMPGTLNETPAQPQTVRRTDASEIPPASNVPSFALNFEAPQTEGIYDSTGSAFPPSIELQEDTVSVKAESGAPQPMLMLLLVTVCSYASLLTIYVIYTLFFNRSSQLESLPDLKTVQQDGGRVRIPRLENALPPGHELKLGQTQRYGNILVTPLRVTKGPITFAHYTGDKTRERSPSEPVLKIWLKIENVAAEQTIIPIDTTLMFFRRGVENVVAYNVIFRDEDRKKKEAVHFHNYDRMAADSEFVIVGQHTNEPLAPHQSFETFIPSEEGIEELSGNLVWRIHLRKGYGPQTGNGVTTLIDVRFNSDDIKLESA